MRRPSVRRSFLYRSLAGGVVVVSALVATGAGPAGEATVGAHGRGPGSPARFSTLPSPSDAAAARAATRNLLASADNLPADCIPNSFGPPFAPYQLGLVGSVRGGVLSTGTTSVAGIDANFCGVVSVVTGTPPCGATGSVSSPPDGQVFGALTVAIDLVPGMTPSVGFTADPGTITGGFTCTSSTGGLQVTLNATVSGTTSPLFGVSCTIGPLTIPLSGTITGPFTNLTGTLSSSNFSVPAVQGSATCPGSVPANIDAIAGLPLSPGAATATLPVSASLYQPAP